MNLDKTYWNNRYLNEQTGWDIGYPSTPLKEYFDQLTNKDLRILIPGCGKSYEGEYLHLNGFKNITLADFAEESKTEFLKRVPSFNPDKFIVGDFFELKGSFDLIIEQTFFCAIDPTLRQQYAKKMKQLLAPKGKLVGLLFNLPDKVDGPPFGGSVEEYNNTFGKHFSNISIEPCYNSIKPREGNEVFIRISI